MESRAYSTTARQDILEILDESMLNFGYDAYLRYEALIVAATKAVRDNPKGIGCKPLPELGENIYQYQLATAKHRVKPPAMRVKNPRHYLLYRIHSDGSVLIGRVLHDRTLPAHYITADTWN